MELQQTVSELCQALCQALKSNYALRNPTSKTPVDYEIVPGRRYFKVVLLTSGHRSVHAFIDKVSGQVFKPASWNAPAKGPRYNLLNEESRQLCLRRADWSGRYLYARG